MGSARIVATSKGRFSGKSSVVMTYVVPQKIGASAVKIISRTIYLRVTGHSSFMIVSPVDGRIFANRRATIGKDARMNYVFIVLCKRTEYTPIASKMLAPMIGVKIFWKSGAFASRLPTKPIIPIFIPQNSTSSVQPR